MLSENVAAGTHQSSIVNQNKCDISNIYSMHVCTNYGRQLHPFLYHKYNLNYGLHKTT